MNKSIFCYALAACLFLHMAVQAHAGDKEPAPAFGNTSLQLIANRGQVTDQHGKLRPDIDAKAEHNGVTMFVGNGQLHYQWVRSESQKSKVKSQKSDTKGICSLSPVEGRGEVSIYRMDVTLVGANKNVQPVFEQPTGYFENYYLAHTGENGVQAKGYNRVVYRDVYPNIDWVIYTSPRPSPQVEREMGLENPKEERAQKSGRVNSPSPLVEREMGLENPKKERAQKSGRANSPSPLVERGAGGEVLKYDFIIHPGGNVADIRMRYDGATELKIEDGALVAVTPYGSITEDAPYSYMQDDGQQVASKYILQGNELRFDVGGYEGTLIIDPKIGWATYYGGSSSENAVYMVTDTGGSIYICGTTGSIANISTNGTHQQSLIGLQDCFVVKFNPTGGRAWGTYYGGSGLENATSIVANNLGHVYLLGRTTSTTGIATNGAYQDTIYGSATSNVFLAKLNTSNGTRVWGTYYLNEYSSNIICDIQGNIYFHGLNSTLVPGMATTGVYMTTPTRYMLTCFNGSGQRVWATYYDMPVGHLYYDYRHNAFYHCSQATINNLPTTTGAWQTSFGGGIADGYLARFTTGGFRQWATYYGGTDNDALLSIATDTAGNVYAAGGSWSTNAIATTGTHQTTHSGGGPWDAIIVKFTPGGQRIWGTYYGGTKQDYITDITIDARENIYVVGHTASTSGIASTNGYKTSLTGQEDALIARFNVNSGQREWATYYGGAGSNYGTSLTCIRGKIYIAGYTTSSSGIANSSGFQNTYGGNSDAMLVEWYADTAVDIREPFNDTVKCTGELLSVPYYVTQNFRNNNVFTVQLSNSSGSFATPVNIGTATTNTAGSVNCTIPLTTAVGTGYRLRIVASAPRDTSLISLRSFRIKLSPLNPAAAISKTTLCTGDTLNMTSSSSTTGVSYKWTGPNSFSINTANASLPNVQTNAAGNYINTIEANGCMVRDTFAVLINQTPENVIAGNNGPVCAGNTLLLTSSSTTNGVSYAWSPGNYNTNNVNIPNAQTTHSGTYTVSATLGNCTAHATTTAVVEQEAVINIISLHGDVVCTGVPARFAGHANSAGTNPQYQWQVNGLDVPGATSIIFQSNILQNGDKVRLKVKPNTSCPSADKFSSEITIIIMPGKTLTLHITSSSNPPWNRNEMVTFNAKATNAYGLNGEPPTYQWRRNGNDIIGANYDYWAVNTASLSDNDVICVFIKSGYQCSQPDTMTSNCINTQFTGVNDVTMSEVKVYPNPVNNVLHIEAPLRLSPKKRGLTVELYDVVGRKCDVEYRNDEIDMSALPSGNYVLQVTGASGERAYFKVTKK